MTQRKQTFHVTENIDGDELIVSSHAALCDAIKAALAYRDLTWRDQSPETIGVCGTEIGIIPDFYWPELFPAN